MLETIRRLAIDLRAYGVAAWNRFGPSLGLAAAGEPARAAWNLKPAPTIGALHPARMRLRLREVIPESVSTRTFRFERSDGPLPWFRAGQYVALHVEIDGIRTTRPYSLSSAPGEPYLDLTVKLRPGGLVTPYLFEAARPGMEFDASGPKGWFCHEPLIDGNDLVFLAGGSGITPFVSMLRDFERRGFEGRIRLLYGSRTLDDVPFREELDRLEGVLKGFRPVYVFSEPPKGWRGPKGFLDAKRLQIHLMTMDERRFFLCGPNPMLDLCRRALAELGVPRHRIRSELYGPPDDVTAEPGWPDDVAPGDVFPVDVGGRRVLCRAGEPLLVALERAGVPVSSACRSGECGACRVRVMEGRAFIPASAGVREADRAGGWVHACVAYPVSPIRLQG